MSPVVESAPVGTRHPPHWAEQGYQGGEVVRAHVEHRTAADLIVEGRGRVPVFVPVAEHRGHRGDGTAYQAIVDQLAACLDARTQERVGSAPHHYAGPASLPQDRVAVLSLDRQGLFAIDVLAGGDGSQTHIRVGCRNRQI